MLHPKPALRPSMARIRAHPFFLPPSNDNIDGNDDDGVALKGIAFSLPPPTAKDSKVIRLFGEVPLYDVYFSYRRSCPADKVTRATFAKSCVYITHPLTQSHPIIPY